MQQTNHKVTSAAPVPTGDIGVSLPVEVTKELRTITSAVGRESGRVIQLSPGAEIFNALLPALDELRDLATGTALRPEGLKFYPTQSLPTEETLSELMETVYLDNEWRASSCRDFYRSAQDDFKIVGDPKRLYHSSLMLDYLVMRYVGWIDPMDLEWFRAEKGDDPNGVGGCDYGFSLSWALKASLAYGRPGFGGSFAEELYRACGQELPEALKAVKDYSVVLAIDTDGLKRAFPTGRVFWPGSAYEYEICCPMLPANIPEVGLAPIAILQWPPGHSGRKSVATSE